MTTVKVTRISQVAAPLFATLALSLIATSASAADTVVPNGIAHPVKLDDLNLSTPEGQATARERITEVARTLCSRVSEANDLGHHEHYVKCVASATNKAMEQILDPVQSPAPNPTRVATLRATGSDQSVRQERVSLSDVDLSTPEGVQTAHERVHAVARKLCSQVEDMNDLSRQTNFDKCIETAMNNAQIEVENLAAKQTGAKSLVGSNR
ncbi:MAG TPA: UrcA family protein [Steroidobacteraceae bacterium]|nr:UrcA family protein [Steroidobacteraceae bacterium]